MKLTEDQIQKLYNFCRWRLVKHYDLQTELVDHLAKGIETQWKTDPDLSFREALDTEFRKFGVFGFHDVVGKNEWAMQKRYWKIIFRFYREYFRLPKVLLTLASIVVLACIFHLIRSEEKYYIILAIQMGIVSFVFFEFFRRRKNIELEQVKYGRKWMLKDQICGFGNIAIYLNLIPIILNNAYFKKVIPIDNVLVEIAFATLIVCMIVLLYVALYVIPKKAEELLSITYPEYKLVD